MMVKKCVAYGCSNTHKDGVSLHKFPNPNTDKQRYLEWLDKSDLLDKIGMVHRSRTDLRDGSRVFYVLTTFLKTVSR